MKKNIIVLAVVVMMLIGMVIGAINLAKNPYAMNVIKHGKITWVTEEITGNNYGFVSSDGKGGLYDYSVKKTHFKDGYVIYEMKFFKTDHSEEYYCEVTTRSELDLENSLKYYMYEAIVGSKV